MRSQTHTVNIKFALRREGNRSLYGDLDFFCIGSGGEILARQIFDVAVYTEVKRGNP